MQNRKLIFIIIAVMAWVAPATRAFAASPPEESGPLYNLPPFERACAVIRYFESLHKISDWPYVGFGHQVQPGEPFKKGKQLSEREADMLLRKDLKKFCSMFRHMGADSLLLACVSYNVGPYRILGAGKKYPKSELLKKLERGDRNILKEYLSFCKYNGRQHPGIRMRRLLEYKLLFKE